MKVSHKLTDYVKSYGGNLILIPTVSGHNILDPNLITIQNNYKFLPIIQKMSIQPIISI